MQQQYECVITNPPYMGGKYMEPLLAEFIQEEYKDVKSDLFSAFIVYCQNKTIRDGYLGFMTPFVWMFISSYEDLRNKIINDTDITSLVQLEYSGFAGATVPISGFGFLLADGAIKGAKKSLFDAITGGITSAGMGITAAIIFGYVLSIIFKSKSKKN